MSVCFCFVVDLSHNFYYPSLLLELSDRRWHHQILSGKLLNMFLQFAAWSLSRCMQPIHHYHGIQCHMRLNQLWSCTHLILFHWDLQVSLSSFVFQNEDEDHSNIRFFVSWGFKNNVNKSCTKMFIYLIIY